MQPILYPTAEELCPQLDRLIGSLPAFDRTFVLCDEHTQQLCLPLLCGSEALSKAKEITIPSGDDHKTLATLEGVWQALQAGLCTRHSLLVCLGGGMVTDLGGLAAATFKRGIAFVNVPTTLLAMVDAAVGGKTGINFCGLKNEIGVFREAEAVVVCTAFLGTLSGENLRSGYAEMLKHGLLSGGEMWQQLLSFPLEDPDLEALRGMVRESIEVKRRIVEQDPHEQGLRKALNLGHTAGHALESLALRREAPVLHGYAVAWGLVCELYLSAVREGLSTETLRQVTGFVRKHYGQPRISCNDYDELYALMLHDKKNTAGHINFTRLSDVAKLRLDQRATREEIYEMFDFLREG